MLRFFAVTRIAQNISTFLETLGVRLGKQEKSTSYMHEVSKSGTIGEISAALRADFILSIT